jgi:aminoglycoside phosphotransferase (APT) family kinase protein
MAVMSAMPFSELGDLVAGVQGELTVHSWDFGGKSFIRACVEDTPAGNRMGAALVRQLLEFEGRCEERWPTAGDAHLVHGDFNPSNILVRDGQVAAILDWEFAHAGDTLMDFGNLLRKREAAVPAGFEDALTEGYRAAGGKLPRDWRPRARYIDLSSACEFLSSAEEKPQVHAAALKQIRETITKD